MTIKEALDMTISSGHPNAFLYRWRFFFSMAERVAIREDSKIKTIAIGSKMAMLDTKNFLKLIDNNSTKMSHDEIFNRYGKKI